MSCDLIRYDAMCRAIDAAYEVDEVKAIRDKAVALEHYFRLAKNPEPERRACEIRIRAENRAGELRRKEEKAKGFNARSPGPQGSRTPTNAERREQLGITEKQDKQWQALSKVPRDVFEAALAGPDKPTTKGVLAAAADPKPKPMDENALWLWGRLRDFERLCVLERSQEDLLDEMTDGMRADCRRLAPLVAAWLEGFDRRDFRPGAVS